MKSVFANVAMAAGLGCIVMAASSAAQAGTVYNAALVGPVYYGTGNDYTPENFAITTEGGIEIGLRSHVRGQVAPDSHGQQYGA